MKKVFLVLNFILLASAGYGQVRCGYVEYMNHLYGKNPDLKQQHDLLNSIIKKKIEARKNLKVSAVPEQIYEIPVVVHVIHNNPSGVIGGANISDAQVYTEIDVINTDYRRLNADTTKTIVIYKGVAADIKVQFCLATLDPDGNPTTGIDRIYSSQSSFSDSDDDQLKGLSHWPCDQYLNIYVCNLTGGILGYAHFPNYSTLQGLNDQMGTDPTDGIVINYRAFGTIGTSSYPYNLGRTTTHEIGHWLGLIHIWGDAYCGDDYVSDTPPQEAYTSGEICDTTATSNCVGTTINMNQNYMDYSADACMNIFTQGQKDRMRTVMEVSPDRVALFNSPACCTPGYKVTIPYKVDFEDLAFLSDGWAILNFDAASSYSQTWTQVSPGAYGQSNDAFMIKNDSVYTSVDTTYWDVLESPYVDLSPATIPALDFDLAYAYNENSTQTDSMVIYYELGCKGDWRVLKTLYGSDLVSTSRSADNFVPGVSEWKKVTVDLTSLKGKKYVKFRIADFSKGINNLYIDNINYYKEANDIELRVYPVPSVSFVNIEVVYEGYKDVKIEAFNTLGKKLLEREKLNSNSFIEQINLTGFETGVYIFRITAGSNKVIRRIVVY
ncbi:MAG TPA: M43 family zinc metalloprotease [Cytophagaceae bacterium]|jgi:hypothetical protein|nr:M43 family zinc metalloprotease [Cytophagaceae bacterium]